LAAFNMPAMEIGGDYYDFFRIDERHLGVAVADVSGKGIGGAIMMSVCRSVLRAQAPGNPNPAAVLKALNRVVSQDMTEDMFASVLYMVLDTVDRRLVVARAGHERPVLFTGDGQDLSLIDSPGVAIGLADPTTFDEAIGETTRMLRPGDVVVAYTDGITEAMTQEGEEWGIDSFLDTVGLAASEGAQSVLNHVRQRLGRFVGTRAQYDDMTMVVLRVRP
jgi:phosphoserine phosphatase RsbU/P